MKRWSAVLALPLAAMTGAIMTGAAFATEIVSPAAPLPGATSDLLTMDGTFLTTIPGSTLFGTASFTLTLTLPAAFVITGEQAFTGTIPFSETFPGTYTVDGHATPFQGYFQLDGGYGIDAAHIAVTSLLTAGDSFAMDFSTTTPLYAVLGPSSSPAGLLASLTTGTFALTFGDASYVSVDPQFTGTVTIAGQGAVPEPAAIALLAPGLLGLAALRRRARARAEAHG